MDEKTIFLVTVFNADGTESARLVNAPTRNAAVAHVLHACKASAVDVWEVAAKGGKVEEAA